MIRLVLSFLLVVIVFSLQVSSQRRSDYSRYSGYNSTYPSYGRQRGRSSSSRSYSRPRSSRGGGGRYSSRYSSTSSYRYATTTTTPTTTPSYEYARYETSVPSYNYSQGIYGGYGNYPGSIREDPYEEYKNHTSSSYSPPDVLAFLPKSVRDWFDNTVKQVGDMASEIVKSKEKTVVEFVDSTLREGEKLVSSLLDEVTKEVMDKTKDSEKALMDTMNDFERKVANIPESMRLIWARDAPLDEKETDQNKEDLADIKKKLQDFEDKVVKETEKEKDLPLALRNQLIKFVTASRGIMNEVGNEDEKMWSKLKLMEKEMFQFQLTFAEASEELKENLNSLFDALKKVALPKLKSVGDADQFKAFMDKLLYE